MSCSLNSLLKHFIIDETFIAHHLWSSNISPPTHTYTHLLSLLEGFFPQNTYYNLIHCKICLSTCLSTVFLQLSYNLLKNRTFVLFSVFSEFKYVCHVTSAQMNTCWINKWRNERTNLSWVVKSHHYSVTEFSHLWNKVVQIWGSPCFLLVLLYHISHQNVDLPPAWEPRDEHQPGVVSLSPPPLRFLGGPGQVT